MSLIECPECGKIYSDKADRCPVCACPTDIAREEAEKNSSPKRNIKKKHTARNFSIFLIILLFVGGAGAFYIYQEELWGQNSKLSDEERARLDSIFLADSIKAAIENAKENIAVEIENCAPTRKAYVLKFKRDIACTGDTDDSLRLHQGDVLSGNIRKDAEGVFHYKNKDSLDFIIPQGTFSVREYETSDIPSEILNNHILLFRTNQLGNTISVRKKKGSRSLYALSYGNEEILAESKKGKLNFTKHAQGSPSPIFIPAQRAFFYDEEYYYLDEIIPIDNEE